MTARHADVDLSDVFVLEQVALLDVDPIDAGGEGEGGENDQGARNLMRSRGPVERPAGLTS